MCFDCAGRSIWIPMIDDLISSGRYSWAYDTLTSIRSQLERSGHITDKQKVAVNNISGVRRRRR